MNFSRFFAGHWLGVFFFALLIIVIGPLTRIGAEIPFLYVIRFPMLIGFVGFSVIMVSSFSGDKLALISFSWFLLWVTFFTLINSPDIQAALLPLGFLCLLFIYVSFGSSKGVELGRYIIDYFVAFSVLFAFINVIQIANPSSFTYGKLQFTGLLENPNAFGNLCAFMVIALVVYWRFFVRGKLLGTLLVIAALMLAVMLVLNFSRASWLAVIVGLSLINIPLRKKMAAGLIVCGVAAIIILLPSVGFGPDGFAMPKRSVFEDTGRGRIFENYLVSLDDSAVVAGAGLSIDGGRIRSELGYLDLLLSSGIGAFGIFVFFARTAVVAWRARGSQIGGMAWPFVGAMLVLGLFEGYLANVMSVLTIMFYVFIGMAHSVQTKRGGATELAP